MATYFETALKAIIERDFDLAKQYLNYATEFGSPREKTLAWDLLRKINADKTANLVNFAQSYDSNQISAAELLSQKNYTEALKELRKRERSGNASPEDFYYLGLLHDDFGVGMPNDKSKAREYYLKAWNRGFAKAGSGYVDIDWDEEEHPLKNEQKRILEKAALDGDSEAKVFLKLERFYQQYSSVTEGKEEKIKEEFVEALSEIIDENDDCALAKLVLSGFHLLSFSSEDRYNGFQTLLALKEHWDTNIACAATVAIAECYRDGLYVSQDLEKAKVHFRDVLLFNKEGGNEEAEEFLSGKWKEIPDESVNGWYMEKLIEYIKKVHDVFYLCQQDWIVAESGEEIREAAENFSAENIYNSVCAEISESATFLNEYLGINDAESKIERKIRNELSRVRHALEDYRDVLMDYIPLFAEEKLGLADYLTHFKDGIMMGVNPIVGGLNYLNKFIELKNDSNETQSKLNQLNQKYGKIRNRLREAEVDLGASLVEIFKEFQESVNAETEESERPLEAYVFCIECGSKNPTHAKFCHECGSKLHR